MTLNGLNQKLEPILWPYVENLGTKNDPSERLKSKLEPILWPRVEILESENDPSEPVGV